MYNKHTYLLYTHPPLKMSSTAATASDKNVIRVENVDKYTQQYVDGALVFTLRPECVTELKLQHNNLTELPELPQSLEKLFCYGNALTSLPEQLPPKLTRLSCQYNKLTQLPEKLPETLIILECINNCLTSLPKQLPPGLKTLECNSNALTSLPNQLPPGLEVLDCRDNKLTVLPDLPISLTTFYCGCNQLDKNYPNLGHMAYSSADRVAYVNKRNREMREEQEPPTIVNDDWIRDTTMYATLKPVSCVIKKNNTIVSNLSPTDIDISNISTDVFNYFGINFEGTNSNSLSMGGIIQLVKQNNMSIDIVMTVPKWPNTNKKYRYTYGV